MTDHGSDVERTIAFFQDLLEFPLAELFENRDYRGSTHFFFDIGHGNYLAYFDFPGLDLGEYREVLGGLHHIAISVTPEQWDRLVAKLVAAEIAARLPLARSTVSAVLGRLGLGRLRYLNPPPPVQRYQWSRPGALVHMDIKKLGRIAQPSHRVTGNRRHSLRGVGWEYMHVAIDDCSRFTYAEILPDEKRYTATGFWLRALREFRRRGIRVERVLTDNGGAYRSRPFRKTCRWLGIAAKRTRPYRPQTNGKAERMIQTLLRKWAYAVTYANSAHRRAALATWLHFYNEERGHASLNRQTPISRLAQFPEQRS